MNLKEIIQDNKFETGFHVLGISPVKDKRDFQVFLDYNQKAKITDRVVWQMAQWWTNYPLKDAFYTESDGTYRYETKSRVVEVTPNEQGKLRMDLDSSLEYPHQMRLKMSEPWSHLLIEQDFNSNYDLSQMEKLFINLNFNIEQVKDLNDDRYTPDLHAAQFLWYFVIADVSGDFVSYGNAKNFLWFGMPLYDSRFQFIEESMHIDQGGEGTTGKLIYSMSNRNYLSEPIQFDKEYNIRFDVLPFVKKAFDYAVENGNLTVKKDSEFKLVYMNFGWELPGSFSVKSYIKEMGIQAQIKTKEI